jgi:pyrroloquinoline quinone biosynthesis protein D
VSPIPSEDVVPSYAPGVRMRHDKVRDAWVVLGPERLFMPDEQAIEILKLVDGVRSIGAIVDDLAARYDAPRDLIATDVGTMLDDLADKGAIRL